MTELQRKYDFLVVGAGMAGASIGAELAAHGSVLVIEMEDQPGYHATGRSVAFWTETYGGPGVQPLTSASGPLLHNPDPAFSDMSFLSPRGTLHIGTQAEVDAREQMIDSFAGAGVEFHRLDEQALHTRIAGLCPEYSIGLAEPSTSDIDVAALHAAYLALLRRRGGDVITRSALQGAERISGGDWQVTTTGGIFAAGLLINAAGA
ncbi:MAG: FAD-dependent oxidoreductase, partial [Sphingobium sp.]